MIKMVVSDLDGTLLNSKKEVPARMDRLVEALSERGIIFAAASGRSRKSLLKTLPGLPIAMIADNGGTAYTTEGELIYCGSFPYEEAKSILDIIEEVPYMTPLMIGQKDVYTREDAPEDILAFMQLMFENTVIMIKDNSEIFDYDSVVKISIQTGPDGKKEQEGLERINSSTEYFRAMLSGDGWVDVMKKGVSKAASLKALAAHYNIRPDEIMIFGDYPNDYDMLLVSPHSYAMKNAHPEIKKICSHITKYSNEEEGVVRELEMLFGLEL